MEVDILCNGNKIVANYIMGAYVFIVVGTMKKMDTCNIDGMCAHALKDICN
jgi:hypothetical protein